MVSLRRLGYLIGEAPGSASPDRSGFALVGEIIFCVNLIYGFIYVKLIRGKSSLPPSSGTIVSARLDDHLRLRTWLELRAILRCSCLRWKVGDDSVLKKTGSYPIGYDPVFCIRSILKLLQQNVLDGERTVLDRQTSLDGGRAAVAGVGAVIAASECDL